MRSLAFRTPAVVPFIDPPGCGPGRAETRRVVRKGGRLYTVIVREKVVVDDPYLVAVRAAAYAIRTGEEYPATATPRALRDFLIRDNVGVI